MNETTGVSAMKNEDNSLSDRFLRKLMNTSPDIGRGNAVSHLKWAEDC